MRKIRWWKTVRFGLTATITITTKFVMNNWFLREACAFFVLLWNGIAKRNVIQHSIRAYTAVSKIDEGHFIAVVSFSKLRSGPTHGNLKYMEKMLLAGVVAAAATTTIAAAAYAATGGGVWYATRNSPYIVYENISSNRGCRSSRIDHIHIHIQTYTHTHWPEI